MSWSISLSGKKHVVQAELRHAVIQMQHALDAVQNAPNEDVAVSVSGHAWQREDGIVGMGTSQSISGIVPEAAAVSEEKSDGSGYQSAELGRPSLVE